MRSIAKAYEKVLNKKERKNGVYSLYAKTGDELKLLITYTYVHTYVRVYILPRRCFSRTLFMEKQNYF